MDRKAPAPVLDERLAQDTIEQHSNMQINLFHQSEPTTDHTTLDGCLIKCAEVFEHVDQLDAETKVAFIHQLMNHLETQHIQTLLDLGQQKLVERRRQAIANTASATAKTHLLLKKDYTYQDRGLSEPTQYYVYLRRRQPKLDRYIGTLFYIPQGCTLSYFLNVEGQIAFNPPHNVFKLKDSKDPSVTQLVRLICLEPPAPDYTFTKQQNDTPEIYLRLEYLDPKTYQPVSEAFYPFPSCMHEGGKLDRYRWDVSSFALPSRVPVEEEHRQLSKLQLPPLAESALTNLTLSSPEKPQEVSQSEEASAKSPRRVLELPPTLSTFYLTNRCDSARVLERMRLWVSWSEKAMPQSRWEIVQNGATYTVMNATFKRNILSFSSDQAAVTLENSLPVLMKWFHDLGLAVSQSQNQRPYSSAQLKLAHSLFIDMSLPQKDSLAVLKKLFGIKFSKTPLKTERS